MNSPSADALLIRGDPSLATDEKSGNPLRVMTVEEGNENGAEFKKIRQVASE